MSYIPYPEWIKPEIIPGLPIRWYGLMYLVAFVITYLLFIYQIKKRKLNISSDTVLSMFFWAIVGLFIGARLFATTIYDPTGRFLEKPWLIFWPFDESGNFTGIQGMSYHGALVGVTVAIVIFCRVKKLDVWDLGDMLVQGLPLGYTFGRLGNFINGELYGKVTDAPWAVLFPNARRVPTSEDWVIDIANQVGIPINEGATLINLPRHPSQIYEAFLEGIVLWLVLWLIVRPRRPFKGFSISIYLLGYAIARFFVEYFREPDEGLNYVLMLGPKDNPPELFMSLLNFSTGQVLNFFMIIAGVAGLIYFKHLDRRKLRAETFEINTENTSKSGSGTFPDPKADDADARKKERRKLRKKLK